LPYGRSVLHSSLERKEGRGGPRGKHRAGRRGKEKEEGRLWHSDGGKEIIIIAGKWKKGAIGTSGGGEEKGGGGFFHGNV